MPENKENTPEIAIAQLRKEYSQKMREQYEKAAENLRRERDEALRENWVLQQRAKAALPEQLSALGINGGASETNLAAIEAQYQQSRGDIKSDYAKELGDIGEKRIEKADEAEKSYNEKWLEYLMKLSQMDKEYEHKKELL